MATRTAGRIVLPKSPEGLLELADKIYKKHQTDGASSALNAQQDFSWKDDGPKVSGCKTNHNEAVAAAKKAEEFYRERDKDLPSIKAIVQNSAQLLKTIYAKNPKVLGEYGFIVDDTKQVKKAKE